MPELVPLTLDEAKRFVALHHRHNRAPVGWKWGVGLEVDGELVGVGVASRPVAPKLAAAEPRTIELTRVCTLGEKNANSQLYGALCRAAKSLGYTSAITYTLVSENGSSLRAAGFVCEGPATTRPGQTWHGVMDLFGGHSTPDEPKMRWRRALAPDRSVIVRG